MKVRKYASEIYLELIGLVFLFLLIVITGYLTLTAGFSLAYIPRAQTPWQSQEGIIFGKNPEALGVLPVGDASESAELTYCIQDEDPEGCAAKSGFLLPAGQSEKSGRCGSVISKAHLLTQNISKSESGLREVLSSNLTDCDYSTGTSSNAYLSTYFVIDAFNLAGFPELSKKNPAFTLGAGLLKWWQSQPKGYKYIPYTPKILQAYSTQQTDLTGCVLFVQLPTGIHPGIVNSFQLVNANGDGVLAMLQAGSKYAIARFDVTGWKIKNSSVDPKESNSILGFGCHE